MIETLLDPIRLVFLVSVALVLGVKWGGRSCEKLRLVAFLVLNGVLLGAWFGGNWQGVATCLVFALVIFGLIRISRFSAKAWIAALLLLLVLLALAKYNYPLWFPHPYRGGIWTRAIQSFLGMPNLKLTIGVSYLCFRLIHVLVDHRGGGIPKVELLPFLNYALFVPVSVSGPINRFEAFERDLANPAPLAARDLLNAIQRVILGLAKTILLAGLISPYTLKNLEPAGPHAALLLMAACVLYFVYIYADFSGYTDIAIGLGRLFGIQLPENFNRPWLATNLQDFWNRWHMTLTGWIKTYVFFPLNLWLTRSHPAGAKQWNAVLSVLVAFILIGIWHGNELNFVVFGLLHGGVIFLNMLLRKHRPQPLREHRGWALAWRRVATVSFVSFSFIVFVYPLNDIPWLMRRAMGFEN